MSYRLIDSNALVQTHPEVNDMPCIYADLDCLDGRLYDLREPSALQAENEKLREQGARLFDKTLELGTENAKLRELMRDTYDCICEMYAYMDGGYAYEDAEADPAYGPILKRMREFGIKTD